MVFIWLLLACFVVSFFFFLCKPRPKLGVKFSQKTDNKVRQIAADAKKKGKKKGPSSRHKDLAGALSPRSHLESGSSSCSMTDSDNHKRDRQDRPFMKGATTT